LPGVNFGFITDNHLQTCPKPYTTGDLFSGNGQGMKPTTHILSVLKLTRKSV